ncbi:hypothetical protein Sme01_03840 [Sphaerisporangium melleum]|uniref:Uncharacterized protein n=1 Tax=Sphaerisporangium melleum TaxID=321316 RepID=A0A917QPQ7_9ACTN|nr:hypothetical protein [Sphaerisporangium melleum]GGK61958.1 hypothetical protein GCM10007964_01390 [Sphaerisporangium melleum]GII67908.1 hypothetical protein Sme01_03840 [Sphaerisporangium melleum]
MANFSRRERTTTWVEYTLPNPVAWGEVRKVIAVIENELGDRAQWDDVVQVVSGDEEIVFRFEKETSNGS